MKTLAIKMAASSLVIGLTMVGCSPERATYGLASVSAKAPRADEDAARLYVDSRAAAERGDTANAIRLAENAVALSPRDSAYRMLLADLYLKDGRFASAETTFADVLELDPDHVRAGLSLALARIAQGNAPSALGVLDRMEGRAPAGDLGLAYALAGRSDRALSLLEDAARADGATGRVRQNLALAHALAGNWERAQTIAAQDVSPAELSARMQYWAGLAQPAAPWTQVAGLLNVTPSADPGQPVRLALAPIAPSPMRDSPILQAEAAPEPALPIAVPEAAPVRMAAAAVADILATPASFEPQGEVSPSYRAEAPTPAVKVHYAAAAQSLVQAEPEVIRAVQQIETPAPVFQRPDAPRVPLQRAVSRPGAGQFVVQIGAYSSAANAERAWASAERRFGFGSDVHPLTTTIDHQGRTLHRVSVAGFANRDDAARACTAIRGQGGTCFVRATAGDAPVRWASRRSGGSTV